jgi:hypothetical protein
VPRHHGAPKEMPWHGSDELLPRADEHEVADLARRLRRAPAGSGWAGTSDSSPTT